TRLVLNGSVNTRLSPLPLNRPSTSVITPLSTVLTPGRNCPAGSGELDPLLSTPLSPELHPAMPAAAASTAAVRAPNHFMPLLLRTSAYAPGHSTLASSK